MTPVVAPSAPAFPILSAVVLTPVIGALVVALISRRRPELAQPAAVLFSMAFALEGGLRWMGLLGFIPLALAFVPGCTACGGRRACSVEESPDGLRHGYRERAAPPGL